MKNMNRDALIELLNSEDIESRKLGINILKNNYNYPLTIYTNKKYDIWSVSPFSSTYRSFDTLHVFNLIEKYGAAVHYFTGNVVNVIIEYDKNELKNFPINGDAYIAR